MNDQARVALVSVLHPVRHAAEGVNDMIWVAKDPSATPNPEEVLRSLAALQREVSRAAGLVELLAREQSPS
jgi:hypothetical protein